MLHQKITIKDIVMEETRAMLPEGNMVMKRVMSKVMMEHMMIWLFY